MKSLLDECVPWPMQRLLPRHSVTSVQAQGWSGIRNSELLHRAEAGFGFFTTSDQNIRYQHLSGRNLAILEFSTNDLRRIRASAELIEKAIDDIRSGDLQRLEIPT